MRIPDNKSFLSFSIFFLMLAVFACKSDKQQDAGPEPSQNQGGGGPRAFPVEVFVVKNRSLEQKISSTGNLIAYESVQIRPERAGKLTDLNFQESSPVKEGQLLARIDDSELLAQKNRLTVNLDLAQKEVARGKELIAVQGISAEEMDRLTNRVDDIQAEQKIIDIQINKSKIYAPFSGLLGLRLVSRGAYITPNDILVELQQINPIKLEFDVPERYLPMVRAGQNLEFTIVGSDKTFEAKVYALGAEISPTTRTFKVRATAGNNQNFLKPGQFAKVTLVTGVNNRAIMVPTDAVIPVLDGKQVFVARKGRAIATKVETSERLADEVEIIDGLVAGDTIIVSGLLSLTDGSPVVIQNVVEPKAP